MKLRTFREKVIKHMDRALDGEVDDSMSFSELWEHVRDHVDGLAEREDEDNEVEDDADEAVSDEEIDEDEG